MDFDKVFEVERSDGTRVPFYGVVEGDSRVVIIKAGAGGDHLGYGEKYLRMARLLNSSSGFTVITASTPPPAEFLGRDKAFVDWYLQSRGILPTEMHYIGSSAGATVGLTEAARCYKFKSMLLINPPLMLNFHKMKRAIEGLADTRLTFVFGGLDPSAKYLPFLERVLSPSHSLRVIPEANHTFDGLLEEFIGLWRLVLDE